MYVMFKTRNIEFIEKSTLAFFLRFGKAFALNAGRPLVSVLREEEKSNHDGAPSEPSFLLSPRFRRKPLFYHQPSNQAIQSAAHESHSG